MKKIPAYSSVVLGLCMASAPSFASDLDVFKQGNIDKGKTVLTLMIDKSGSMARFDGCGNTYDIDFSDYQYYSDIYEQTLTWEGKKITLYYAYCTDSNNNKIRMNSRMSDVKLGLYQMLTNNDLSEDKYVLGFGVYPTNNSYVGSIQIPAKPLTNDHRKSLLEAIEKIEPSGGTPIANAFAEAGAYMMGTSTNSPTNIGQFSGFSGSDKDTKNSTKTAYKQGAIEPATCGGGNGIYFMTDGAPNSATYNGDLVPFYSMNNSLNRASNNPIIQRNSLGCTGTSLLSGSANKAWNCSGEFAKILRETSNPSGIEIKTATAGFGPAYDVFKGDLDDPAVYNKLGKYIKVGEDKDGNDVTRFQYDCDLVTNNEDAKNLCLLGEPVDENGQGGKYGQGGFYYLDSAEKVKTSIVEFARSLDGETAVQPISTGTFTIPLDPVDNNSPRYDAYLPILAPNVGSKSLWRGNLKKYKIVEASIRGADNNNIVLNTTGLFNPDTYDFWNEDKADDKGLPSIGGTLSRVFHKKTDGTYENKRYLYVDSDKTLKRLSVTDSKPSGFDALSSSYTLSMKQNLLNYLGYKGEDAFEVKDGNELKESSDANAKLIGFDETNKVHGGVLHSYPQLITKRVVVNAKGEQTERDDYILYGSFDGALHLVDDETGDEKFSFVPEHVLANQGSYFKPESTSNPKSDEVGYGVDGPWTVYSKYVFNTGSTKVNIVANQIFAFGGLRMGGTRYYGLNLSNINNPSMIYSVGSTDTGYERMGQSWAQPSIGYIKRNNKKFMVNFLAGGYDMRYEETDYSPTASNPAKGNAVYAVRVGREIKTTSGKTKINVSNPGQRMFWLSQKGATKNNANMYNSIVSEVIALDRDYDGYTDHLLFSDLGGQVFRADLDNSGSSVKIVRIVRLLNVAADKGTNDTKPRFYQSPLITFMRWKNGKIVGVVSVGSGDLSSPLSDRTQANRVYTFIDRDIATNDDDFLDSAYSLKTQNINSTNLEKLAFKATGEESSAVQTAMEANSNAKDGWYYPLEYWNNDQTSKVTGMKMITPMSALDSVLFYSSFNPKEVAIGASSQCGASVVGKSQRETLCLPFGACNGKKYKTQDAGAGIIQTNIGFVNSDKDIGGCKGKNCIGVVSNNPVVPDPNQPPPPVFEPQDTRVDAARGLFPTSWLKK